MYPPVSFPHHPYTKCHDGQYHRDDADSIADKKRHIVTYRGEEVKRLTRLEYGMLALLYENRGKSVSYTDFSELWEDSAMSEASLQNYISRIRKALSVDSTVSLDSSGRGYILLDV